jgi:hypothetical protein
MNYISDLINKNIKAFEEVLKYYIETYALNMFWALIVVIL